MIVGYRASSGVVSATGPSPSRRPRGSSGRWRRKRGCGVRRRVGRKMKLDRARSIWWRRGGGVGMERCHLRSRSGVSPRMVRGWSDCGRSCGGQGAENQRVVWCVGGVVGGFLLVFSGLCVNRRHAAVWAQCGRWGREGVVGRGRKWELDRARSIFGRGDGGAGRSRRGGRGGGLGRRLRQNAHGLHQAAVVGGFFLQGHGVGA